MSEDKFEKVAKTLESAVFHAWVTLGEMLAEGDVDVLTRADIRNAYEVLEQALEEYKKVKGTK